MIKISTPMKKRPKTQIRNLSPFSEQGLSLIEILVALSLSALLFLSVEVISNPTRSNLDEALESIERAIRYSADEAVLRGSIVRVHLILDKTPQEIAVEAGPSGDFVLPSFENLENQQKLSLGDQEKKENLTHSLNQKFRRIAEYTENKNENYALPENIQIVAFGSETQEKLVSDGDAAVYVFPSGEKDASIIFLSTPEEIAALTIDPFTDDIHREYIKLESSKNKSGEEALATEQEQIIQQTFQKWKTQGHL